MDKKVYQAANLQDAEIMKVQLERANFSVTIKGGYLSGALGELPAGPDTSPSIWVIQEDFEEVMKFLKDLQMESEIDYPGWTCPGCGELVEGTILTCWNCGHELENAVDNKM
jgi:hypothetical protein